MTLTDGLTNLWRFDEESDGSGQENTA